MINRQYVIYKLSFPNGKFYIGKAKDFERRVQQHQKGEFNGVNLKERTVIENKGFKCKVIASAPITLSESEKQIWMDNMERIIIHRESQKTYNEITGQNSQFSDYQPFRKIINQKMVNTQLY